MRTLTTLLIVTLPFAFAACGSDSDPTAVNGSINRSDLQYMWVATRAEFTSKAQPTVKREIIGYGGEATLDLRRSDYEFSWSNDYDPVAHSSVSITYLGSWSIANNRLTLSNWNDMTFTLSLSGNSLTLTGGPCEYDFNGDGTEEEATLAMVLVRQ